MGMLIGGKWSPEDQIIHNGKYLRPSSVFANDIAEQIIENITAHPRRYLLIGSNSCQWSHRTIIIRQQKGLSRYIPLHIAHGPRTEGYAIDGGNLWQVPGTNKSIRHLHQLYSLSHHNYTGRSTVPVLWDSHALKIVSNESSMIMRAFDAVHIPHLKQKKKVETLYPDFLEKEMNSLDEQIYHGLSNGVYKAGFAQTQEAYDQAVVLVFETLEMLEDRLAENRYLLGSKITASDWKLFTTLLRFDLVYHPLHRCMKHRLIDYPNLWDYTRELYQIEGVSDTIDFKAICQASFANDTENNKYDIIPISPEINWDSPHNRNNLSTIRPATQ